MFINLPTQCFSLFFCLLFACSSNAVQWQENFNLPIGELLSVGLSGPFPMIYVFDENDKVIFYGKGIDSKAHETLMTLNLNKQQPIDDDSVRIAEYILPKIYNKNKEAKTSNKKLVVLSLDEASFKTATQDKCTPCRTVFATIDENSSKVAHLEKVLINMTR